MSGQLRGLSLYALDPGTEQSALVCVHHSGLIHGQMWANADLIAAFHRGAGIEPPAHLIVEQIESFGMPVGREIFDTALWSGRFIEAWQAHGTWSLLPRRAVKLALCGTARAKDANIRQALLDRYGGPQAARKGGALAGIKSHLWSALALAQTYQEQAALAAKGAYGHPSASGVGC